MNTLRRDYWYAACSGDRRRHDRQRTAILGVRDEVELIGASIAHLRRVGVDHICVVDYGSVDGTLDVVKSAQRRGWVSLTQADPDVVVDHAASSAHDLAIARATGAEWMITVDADEFWLPATGSLPSSGLDSSVDVLTVERYNVALADDGLQMPRVLAPSQYHRLQLLTRRPADFQRFVSERPDVPFITLAPGHKAAGRLTKLGAIMPGGHDFSPHGPATSRRAADIVIAHVAFSTWDRFARKVTNIRDEMRRHPAFFAGALAWHWRRWAELGDGALRLEFQRQIADRPLLAKWREEGVLQSAGDVLGLPVPSGLGARLAIRAAALATRARAAMLTALRPLDGRPVSSSIA